jgi:uncharacterized SAM-binding protein YcdF (DUF218 family)
MLKYDAIIILSHELTPNRELNAESILRVDKGLELYHKGLAKFIIMNGGPGPFTKITPMGKYVLRGTHPVQSEVMRDYAISKKIPKNNILIEDYPSDTVGEAYFVKEDILVQKNWKNIVIVTSTYHMPRVKVIYQKILGPLFNINFISLPVPADNDKTLRDLEKSKIKLFLEQFNHVKSGDSEMIEKILYTKHEMYSKIPLNERKMFF